MYFPVEILIVDAIKPVFDADKPVFVVNMHRKADYKGKIDHFEGFCRWIRPNTWPKDEIDPHLGDFILIRDKLYLHKEYSSFEYLLTKHLRELYHKAPAGNIY